MDRGANGGILGSDARVITEHNRHVDITGIDNHEITNLKIVDGAGLVTSQRGPIIAILRQYAYHGIQRTIHSAGQIEHYKNIVHDRSIKANGRQCIVTNDGFIIPLDIIHGLAYMKMSPPSDKEMEELPHIILTSGHTWNPKVLDYKLSDKEDWYNEIRQETDHVPTSSFDAHGNYKHRTPHKATTDSDDDEEDISTSYIMQLEALQHDYSSMCNLNQPMILSEETYTILEADTNDQTKDETTVEVPSSTSEIKPRQLDYKKYSPFFLHVPVEKIRKTFQRTTQFSTNIISGNHIKQTLQSPFPAHNVRRRNEPVATDTVKADTAAVDSGGQRMAQIFVGRKSLVVDVYGMSTSAQMVNTLEDVIRHRGAPDKLISDSASDETSQRVKEILRALCIDDWQSEPHYQHQNFAEHRWNHVKRNHRWFMNYRNVDPEAWLLCLQWVADVMNHTAEKSLGWRPPLEVLTGQTVDISIIICGFLFWDVVYVHRYKEKGYSGQPGSTKSDEIRGRFVGFAWSCGHELTFKILTDDTKKIIHRSRVRLAKEGVNNLKLDVESGAIPERVYIKSKRDDESILPTIDLSEGANPIIQGIQDTPTEKGTVNEATPMDEPKLSDRPEVETVDEDEEFMNPDAKTKRKPGEPNPDEDPLELKFDYMQPANPTIPGLPPEEMINRTFLMPPADDGSRVRAKIIERINHHKDQAQQHPDYIKFKCRINNQYDEIVDYNDIVDYIEQDDNFDGGHFKFENILDHEGPLNKDHKRYKGCTWNVLIEWTTGEKTWEPLYMPDKSGIGDTDHVTTAIYASKKGLLDTPGWKKYKKIAKSQKNLMRFAKQAKLHSFRTKPIYMYGFLVPRNHEQAMEIDRQNGNTKWRDAELIELAQIHEYQVFINKGRGHNPGKDWKKIRVHFVYAVKHDGRHKARLVAGGHLTDTPIDSVYSSVVSLRGIRLITFIAELNGLDLWATDIGNAYLESYTKEQVYIVAGSEFGELAGCTLLISRALYGLKSSGLRWHERFADVLRSMDFFPSKAERDIWMRDKGDHYEYIAVYVDDLLIASKECSSIIKALEDDHSFKLKGSGPVTFHLGCDFFRDSNGNLCYAPKKYIEKVLANYQRIFGKQPWQVTSPLIKGDHPEIDTSELLNLDDQKIYQSLIGSLQWTIQIGRFDIATATMTLSRFRAAPRKGHLERVKRVCGYLSKMRHAIIRIRTEEPDYSTIPKLKYDWTYTCYQGAKEHVPDDVPKPLGKRVQLTTYVDANLYHDLISGRSVTGILHLANKTPIDWYSKLQATVETATYGSEFVAARTASEQIQDLRLTFRYLGVTIDTATMMFGDNETVVNSSSIPHSRLMKRHNALSYHKTREAIASGMLRFHHIPGTSNPADILSKHWDYPSVWPQLRPLLFWEWRPQNEDSTKPESKKGSNVDMSSSIANEGSESVALAHGTDKRDSP